jgi:hypothetical protein
MLLVDDQIVISREAKKKLEGSELAEEKHRFSVLGKLELPDNPKGTCKT